MDGIPLNVVRSADISHAFEGHISLHDPFGQAFIGDAGMGILFLNEGGTRVHCAASIAVRWHTLYADYGMGTKTTQSAGDDEVPGLRERGC